MGWFSSEPPKPASPATPLASSDGAFIAPDRSSRKQCWEARDAFFRCLDHNNIIDSVKEQGVAAQRCGPEGQEFERNCASSWVQYFKKRRVVEHSRDETLKRLKAEGAQPLPEGVSLPPQGVNLPSGR